MLQLAKLVLCTTPNDASAKVIANALVEENLAACVNILPRIKSVYRWREKIEYSDEHLLFIKTSHYDEVEDRIKALHPYDLPEIIAINISQGLPEYLAWLNS